LEGLTPKRGNKEHLIKKKCTQSDNSQPEKITGLYTPMHQGGYWEKRLLKRISPHEGNGEHKTEGKA